MVFISDFTTFRIKIDISFISPGYSKTQSNFEVRAWGIRISYSQSNHFPNIFSITIAFVYSKLIICNGLAYIERYSYWTCFYTSFKSSNFYASLVLASATTNMVVVKKQSGTPVYIVRSEDDGRERVLHENLLTQCMFLPTMNEETPHSSETGDGVTQEDLSDVLSERGEGWRPR